MKSKIMILLVACVFLAGCSAQVQTATSAVEPVSVMPSETEELILTTATESVSSAPSETEEPTSQPGAESDLPLYEVISPESIQAENGTLIELNSASIEIHPVMGTRFRLGFRYTGITRDQIPESRAEYVDPPFITDLQFFRGEDETPIRLDVGGAGGGQHQTDSGALSLNQSQTYQFPDDMVVGQEEHIIVLVTFHEIFGISEVVRYEFDLLPLQGPLG